MFKGPVVRWPPLRHRDFANFGFEAQTLFSLETDQAQLSDSQTSPRAGIVFFLDGLFESARNLISPVAWTLCRLDMLGTTQLKLDIYVLSSTTHAKIICPQGGAWRLNTIPNSQIWPHKHTRIGSHCFLKNTVNHLIISFRLNIIFIFCFTLYIKQKLTNSKNPVSNLNGEKRFWFLLEKDYTRISLSFELKIWPCWSLMSPNLCWI